MHQYSQRSKAKLAECDPEIQQVFALVIQIVDCTIFTGHRPEAEQNEMQRTGKSQLRWPHGTHNKKPSHAIDAAPYPINWKDRERATLFAGLVLGIAYALGVNMRWGGDWNKDWQVKDNNFDDLYHFELAQK